VAGTELLSFLHISDLHFGVPPEHAAPPPTPWRHLALCDGWLGHDLRAVIHLADFVLDHEREASHMVITGDLTACGKEDEFATATQFVESSIKTHGGRIGLRHRTVLRRSIPGNHDHWPGSIRVIGRANPALKRMFPALPFDPYRIDLPGGRAVIIAGINSDHDVFDSGLTRIFARGKFISQLQALQGVLGTATPGEIRVLLVHHSPSWTAFKLGIDDDSAAALWEFIKQYGFAVLLTGHIHIPIGRVRQVSHDGRQWEVLEARCGTTTQTDQQPLNWVGAGERDPFRFPRN
jgi:predicted phosphodiesterase